MIALREAIDLAEERKRAALGDDAGAGVNYSPAELNDRLVFSGLEVNYAELAEVAAEVGSYFAAISPHYTPSTLLMTAWVDGLLIGLLAGREISS